MAEVDEVRSYGLSSVPIGWVPTKYQGVVEALRRLHLGQGDEDAVRDAVVAMDPNCGYDVADLVLGHPVSAKFTVEVDGLHAYVESPGSVGLPGDAVVWSFGDGSPSVRKAAKVAHRYSRPGRYLIQCDVSVAGNTFNEMDYVRVELLPVERDDEVVASADLPVEYADYEPSLHDESDVVNAIGSATSAVDVERILVREREGLRRDRVIYAAVLVLDAKYTVASSVAKKSGIELVDWHEEFAKARAELPEVPVDLGLPDNDRFDPADWAVDDVEDHLKVNDATEAARVLGLEQLGKNRKGVLSACERRIVKGDD